MKAGAVDFLTKPVDRVRLLKAVKEAVARNAGSRTADAEQKILQQRFDTLSARELDVYRGVVAGLLNKQIAAELGISERTVKVSAPMSWRRCRRSRWPNWCTWPASSKFRRSSDKPLAFCRADDWRRWLGTAALKGSELPQGPIARAHGWVDYSRMPCVGRSEGPL